MAEGSDYVSVVLPEVFEKAANHIKTLVSKLESNQLLELYAYYKQSVEGPCNIPRPHWYEMQAKQKWEAWYGLGDMDRETAMKRYVDFISELDPGWEDRCSDKDLDNAENSSFRWVTVSCMSNTDDNLSDTDKTIFDWVKESNADKVLEFAQNSHGCKVINAPDSTGMSLIHWAADRGDLVVLQCLVGDLKADINLKDGDGQTALHYAASCGHADAVKFLIGEGADPNITDNEGMLPVDVASDSDIDKALRITKSL